MGGPPSSRILLPWVYMAVFIMPRRYRPFKTQEPLFKNACTYTFTCTRTCIETSSDRKSLFGLVATYVWMYSLSPIPFIATPRNVRVQAQCTRHWNTWNKITSVYSVASMCAALSLPLSHALWAAIIWIWGGHSKSTQNNNPPRFSQLKPLLLVLLLLLLPFAAMAVLG